MRKLMMYILACAIFFSPGCFLDDDSDEDPTEGTGVLEVTVTYDDASSTTIDFGNTDATPGTAENYVYLYESLGVASDSPMPKYSGSSASNGSKISINKITAGEYYLVVCYDYRGANEEPALSKKNPYEFYNGASGTGTALTSNATKIQITDNNTSTYTISFYDRWQMGTGMTGGRYFLTSE